MKNSGALFRFTTAVFLAAFAASPAAAQVDFTTFVQIGDSLTAGYTDGCLVIHGQADSYGAIIARQAGASSFQQPIVGEPGLGGCLVLTSLAPTFSNKPSTGAPLNVSLPRPYNNMAIPGFTVSQVSTSRTAADNGNPLTDLVLRNPASGNTTMLQQAALLKPTFTTIFIGNNDILGPVSVAAVSDPGTLISRAAFQTSFQTIVSTMQAAQSGTGRGIVFGIPDVTTIPFTTTIPPIITLGGKPVINPATGAPFTFLGQESQNDPDTGLNIGFNPVAPLPTTALLTLQAAPLLAVGYGIPCSILTAGGVPSSDPHYLNCDSPLRDGYLTLDLSSGTPVTKIVPGVVLFPDEVALAKSRTDDFNSVIQTVGTAAGYKFFDTSAYLTEVQADGRNFGGMTVTTAFLQGGFFGYDGVHPTSIGYAIVANDLIKFINSSFGVSIPAVDMSVFLYNGDTQPGGYPAGLAASPDQILAWAAEIFGNPCFQATFSALFAVNLPESSQGHIPIAIKGPTLHGVERLGRIDQH